MNSAVSMATPDTTKQTTSLVPDPEPGYVPFGHFSDLETIITSQRFYPVYVQGLSGNGKTLMAEQVCSKLGRECVRVNITAETDEDDLIGGFRLIDGKTVWHNGPVIIAMEKGAILLLDEVDLGSIKLMCLQPVLEGKGIFIKKINRVVKPLKGFNVVATANTKGQGSASGRFIGTNIMNEAFLERFAITMEQEYPSANTEERILDNVFKMCGLEGKDVKEFGKLLVKWADVVRKSFYADAVQDVISTRRLVHICQAYSMFGQNRSKAIEMCLSRFEVDVKASFLDLYSKVDADIRKEGINVKMNPGAAAGPVSDDELLASIAGAKPPF